ncbi:uncharacterized protein LOC111386977 [Olea europaea subsp. europaea]|uniref:Uncharacterized protein LOC111386977 n=1 Tax=Olea europaea subsp. europaea TaxID=158383 RepID=A0A8S0TND6_OLEEU|nr:uncharacterized protein LOC111386977 [Olea europaea subsp. europaea]
MARFHLVFLLLLATIFIIHAMDASLSANAEEQNPQKLKLGGRTLFEKQQKHIADPPEINERESSEAEAPVKHHSSSDKSVAGGGVIIGGLVTAIFAAVYCYIRVTRRRTTTTNDQITV